MPRAIFDLTLDEKVDNQGNFYMDYIYGSSISVLNFLIIIFARRMLRVLKYLG